MRAMCVWVEFEAGNSIESGLLRSTLCRHLATTTLGCGRCRLPAIAAQPARFVVEGGTTIMHGWAAT